MSGAGFFGILGGALYAILRLRERLSDFSWSSIQENIKHHLLGTIRITKVLTSAEEAYLLSGRRLIDLFYRLADNDASLLSRQDGVRFNGILVTSAADLGVVSLLGWFFHFCFALYSQSLAHAIWSTCCFCLWIGAQAFLLPLTLRRHRELSNEQLDYIANNLRPLLTQHVDEILP
jgi:hypothetical protein